MKKRFLTTNFLINVSKYIFQLFSETDWKESFIDLTFLTLE